MEYLLTVCCTFWQLTDSLLQFYCKLYSVVKIKDHIPFIFDALRDLVPFVELLKVTPFYGYFSRFLNLNFHAFLQMVPNCAKHHIFTLKNKISGASSLILNHFFSIFFNVFFSIFSLKTLKKHEKTVLEIFFLLYFPNH